MSSLILIGASILLTVILADMLIRRFNLLKPFKKEKNNTPLFLSNEEALRFISEKALLSEEEKEHLALLFTITSGNRLHQGFEDKDVAEKWLTSARRAIVNSTQFDANTKEELEYSVYEINRKINNTRMLTHPSVKYITDINIGQPVSIIFVNRMTVPAVLSDYNFYSFSVEINISDASNMPKKLDKKKVQISFWKIMDAQYSFVSKITAIEKKDNKIILICSNPHKILCTKIRSFPRQEVEIPIKFRQATVSIDSDTGGLVESFGGHLFGIINNLSTWGCSLISYVPIPIHTVLKIEIPLFSEIIQVKGTIKNLSRKGDIFILNIEFVSDTPKATTLTIYHYLFAEDSSASR